MDYRNGETARRIIELQKDDGTWGNMFHSLAMPTNRAPLTTEQALRRLKILGFTIQDPPIRKAVDCMTACLRGERKIDDYWEKGIDWDLYTKLMLSTWVRIFEPNNETALTFARRWANIMENTFEGGTYDAAAYQKAYMQEFYNRTKGGREIDFVSFYEMNLLQGLLSKKTESLMLDYVLQHKKGIYYIYYKPIDELPSTFASIEASRYLSAVEILAGYQSAGEKLGFVVQWLEDNKDENGQWDFGSKARDNIYFPLSDSWRTAAYRKADCTERVSKIINVLTTA